jgi:hypothetical protein
MGWSWWFRHWQRWLAAQLPRNLQEAPERSADDWFQKRQAEARVNRALFAALIGAALVLAVAITGYEQFRVSIASGTLWLEPSAATTTARLVVNRPVQRVLVENTFGEGVVVAELRSVAASTAVFEQASLTLHGIPREYTHAQVGPNTLAPGAYILTMRLQSGTGGRVSYALVQSNGFASQVVAVLVSLFGGIVLALVVLLLSVRFTGAE